MPDPIELWKAAGPDPEFPDARSCGYRNADANTNDREGDGGVEAVAVGGVRLWP